MGLKEFYESIGENYESVLTRMMGREDFVKKFLLRFFQSDENYQNLEEAMSKNDYENALIYAHTLKGVSVNLSLTPIYTYSSKIVDLLRKNETSQLLDTFHTLQQAYETCLDLFKRID